MGDPPLIAEFENDVASNGSHRQGTGAWACYLKNRSAQ
jgi:hypothetical protein